MKKRKVTGIIDPHLPLAMADHVIAKRWPGMTRAQWLGAYRLGEIGQTGIASDVAGILFLFGPLAERGPLPLGPDGEPMSPDGSGVLPTRRRT